MSEQTHIGIDVGKWKMGLCALTTVPGLAFASAVRVDRPWDETKAVNAVLDALQDARRAGLDLHHAHVHIEQPRHYGGGGGALQKDVELLEALAVRLRTELKPLGYQVRLYRPHEWKRSVPKPVHHRRIRRALTKPELELIEVEDYGDAQADVWDGIGLALFGAGRLQQGGKRA